MSNKILLQRKTFQMPSNPLYKYLQFSDSNALTEQSSSVEYLWQIFWHHSENTQTIVDCRLHPIIWMNNKDFVKYPQSLFDPLNLTIIEPISSKFKRQVLLFIVISAKSTNFTTNTTYTVIISTDTKTFAHMSH